MLTTPLSLCAWGPKLGQRSSVATSAVWVTSTVLKAVRQ
jgi:hypothetical protein